MATGAAGQGIVEYAVMLALIVVVMIAVPVLPGPAIGRVFSQASFQKFATHP